MRNLLYPIVFGIFCFLISCQPKGNETVTVIKHGKNTEYLIHLKEVKDSLSLRFTDFVTDYQVVPLESNEECLLSKGKYYVTESYILVQKRNHGILQFDRKGKFIRTLAKFGSGPTEYARAGWTVDEDRQILFMADWYKRNYLLQFDLHSGEYLGDLKKAIPCKSAEVILTDDNYLAIVPTGAFIDIEEAYYFYLQDFNGELINKADAPTSWINRYSENTMIKGNEFSRFQLHYTDTVCLVQENQLIPYLVFDFGEKNPPRSTVGHKDMRFVFENNSWVILQKFTVTGVTSRNGATIAYGENTNFILDKREAIVYHMRPFSLDVTHHTMPPYDDRNFKVQGNGLVFLVYEAVDLLEQAEKALGEPDFKEPYRSKLKAVIENLSEEDNPVLFIGKYK